MKEYKSSSSFFVFDKDLNYANSLFGGKLMAEADCEAAKVGRQIAFDVGADNAVTVSFNMSFLNPAIKGDLIDMDAHVKEFGRTSVTIEVDCYKTNREGDSFIGTAVTKFVILKDGKPFPHNLKNED